MILGKLFCKPYLRRSFCSSHCFCFNSFFLCLLDMGSRHSPLSAPASHPSTGLSLDFTVPSTSGASGHTVLSVGTSGPALGTSDAMSFWTGFLTRFPTRDKHRMKTRPLPHQFCKKHTKSVSTINKQSNQNNYCSAPTRNTNKEKIINKKCPPPPPFFLFKARLVPLQTITHKTVDRSRLKLCLLHLQ